jgi:hypothetical protein
MARNSASQSHGQQQADTTALLGQASVALQFVRRAAAASSAGFVASRNRPQLQDFGQVSGLPHRPGAHEGEQKDERASRGCPNLHPHAPRQDSCAFARSEGRTGYSRTYGTGIRDTSRRGGAGGERILDHDLLARRDQGRTARADEGEQKHAVMKEALPFPRFSVIPSG